MYYITKENSKGKLVYKVAEKYKDPLTGKWRTATVSYSKNTSRARKQAERDLLEKIERLTSVNESKYNPEKIKTFGELKASWLETWCASVKPQTVTRETFVINRLGQIIGDDCLLDKITPLLMKNCLNEYARKYDSSPSTMTHIKSTCNKIFNHGVLYGIIKFSPMTAVKVDISLDKKRAAKKRHEAKFLKIHELHAFFDILSKGRNPNYYDLAIVLLLTGIRIGEAAFLPSDIDSDKKMLHINKSLQYHDLRVSEFHFDSTKTINADRDVALPEAAYQAIQRAIDRSREFDSYMLENPNPAFMQSESVFRTEYGSPITSHSFRQVLSRVEEELKRVCEVDYGFKWEKHVTPHSFRHMHISYLQSREMQISLKDVMSRVGHANFETTMGYTHKISDSQSTTVKALDQFVENHHFNFGAVKSWSCKYSAVIEKVLQTQIGIKELEYSLEEFRELLHLKSTYAPKQIVSNIIPKVIKDILKYYQNFTIEIVKITGSQIKGFKLTW